MSPYTPKVKDIRTRNTRETLRLRREHAPISIFEQQYELNFDVQSDSHLRTLLRNENKASLSDFINS